MNRLLLERRVVALERELRRLQVGGLIFVAVVGSSFILAASDQSTPPGEFGELRAERVIVGRASDNITLEPGRLLLYSQGACVIHAGGALGIASLGLSSADGTQRTTITPGTVMGGYNVEAGRNSDWRIAARRDGTSEVVCSVSPPGATESDPTGNLAEQVRLAAQLQDPTGLYVRGAIDSAMVTEQSIAFASTTLAGPTYFLASKGDTGGVVAISNSAGRIVGTLAVDKSGAGTIAVADTDGTPRILRPPK